MNETESKVKENTPEVKSNEETELERQAKELFGDVIVVEDSSEVYDEVEEFSHE